MHEAQRLGRHLPQPGPRLAVVQPNLRHTIRNVTGVHLTQIDLTERFVPPGGADLIVWPENAVFADLKGESVWREDIAWLAARHTGHGDAAAPILAVLGAACALPAVAFLRGRSVASSRRIESASQVWPLVTYLLLGAGPFVARWIGRQP